MCKYYAHIYNCKHTTYALGKYCHAGNLIQQPCEQKTIWQTLNMGEDCEDCAIPAFRGGDIAEDTKEANPVTNNSSKSGQSSKSGGGKSSTGRVVGGGSSKAKGRKVKRR